MASINVTTIYPAMLHSESAKKPTWTPEDAAFMVKKTPLSEPQDDEGEPQQPSLPQTAALHDSSLLQSHEQIPTRVSRSQSLTEPKTPPMFPSPNHAATNSSSSSIAAAAELTRNKNLNSLLPSMERLGRLASGQPSSEPETIGASHTHRHPAVGLTLLQQQLQLQHSHRDPRTVRRDRRSLSAEFTLSMLQQELGYPTRKSSRSRRDSVEKGRRTSSILEESVELFEDGELLCYDEHNGHGSTTSNNSSKAPRSDGSDEFVGCPEPDPERTTSSRHSLESAKQSSNRSKRNQLEDEEEEEEENFMDSRIASVTGFSQDTDGVVYYEIIVRSIAYGPLSAYKVRRRYSEFRDLHRALAKVMPTSRKLSTSASGSVLTAAGMPLRFSSTTDGNEDDDGESLEASSSLLLTQSPLSGAGVAVREPKAFRLPPLPDRGGVWSYFQFDTTPFLERRAQYFQAMLVAAQNHPRARASRLLNDFLGPPPDSVALHTSVENSYVSLNRFAVPKLRLSVEAQERKQKARNISRRRSSVSRACRRQEA